MSPLFSPHLLKIKLKVTWCLVETDGLRLSSRHFLCALGIDNVFLWLTANRQIEILELEDLEKECSLARIRLTLAQHDPAVVAVAGGRWAPAAGVGAGPQTWCAMRCGARRRYPGHSPWAWSLGSVHLRVALVALNSSLCFHRKFIRRGDGHSLGSGWPF